ncbi:hypothetical protein QCA50_006647 [Cerrena zonata]|uniref:Uncharacterized protein n=1 Tax=Cerrena zonata TaxID=2478898 RepID=A0AAW0GFR0_9APHY
MFDFNSGFNFASDCNLNLDSFISSQDTFLPPNGLENPALNLSEEFVQDFNTWELLSVDTDPVHSTVPLDTFDSFLSLPPDEASTGPNPTSPYYRPPVEIVPITIQPTRTRGDQADVGDNWCRLVF